MPCQKNSKFETRNSKLRRGFSLIELLIVVSLIAIAGTLVSASYLGFERRQKIENAALEVKNTIRRVQNDAISARKVCTGTYSLVGWYIFLTKGANKFTVASVCTDGGAVYDISGGSTSVKLPTGVITNDIRYNGSTISGSSAYIFFQTLKRGVTFHSNSPFVDPHGEINLIGILPQGTLTIQLLGFDSVYSIDVLPSGEVNEKNP